MGDFFIVWFFVFKICVCAVLLIAAILGPILLAICTKNLWYSAALLVTVPTAGAIVALMIE